MPVRGSRRFNCPAYDEIQSPISSLHPPHHRHITLMRQAAMAANTAA